MIVLFVILTQPEDFKQALRRLSTNPEMPLHVRRWFFILAQQIRLPMPKYYVYDLP